MIVGIQKTEAQKHERDCRRKVKAFNDILNFVSIYVKDIDKKRLAVDPIATFTEAYYNQCGKPKFLSSENTLKYSDIDLDLLHNLTMVYLRIPVDFDGINTVSKDFNIYTKNKEQEVLYKDLKSICDAINHLQDNYQFTTAVGMVSQAFNGAIVIDYSNFPKMIPNPNFVIRYGIKY
jgi:hypothetical protein